MTSKEWVEEKLYYNEDQLTTTDRIMLTKILKDLNLMEQFGKAISDMINYLKKEPNRAIPKHSIKQKFDKILKEVLSE